MQFFSELDEDDVIKGRIELISKALPCLEFFSAPSSSLDAIELTRKGDSLSWQAVELKQWDLHFDSEKYSAT